MTTWTRRAETVTSVIYDIPAPGGWACWTEVARALSEARAEYARLSGHEPSDDAMRVQADKNMITIAFTHPGKDSGDGTASR